MTANEWLALLLIVLGVLAIVVCVVYMIIVVQTMLMK